METIQFKTLSTAELKKLSEQELKDYTAQLKEECSRIESETLVLTKKAEEDRLKTAELKGELKVWKERNLQLMRQRGWQDLTDDEMKWLMDGAYHKYWEDGKYFLRQPSQEEIKRKYAEVMKKDMDQDFLSKFDVDPDMKKPSGWVDRRGTYFPVGFAEHDQWAWKYLTERYGPIEGAKKLITPRRDAHEYLEAMGWVRIMKWDGLDANFILPKKMSHAQKQTVDRYCQLYGWPLPFEDPLF